MSTVPAMSTPRRLRRALCDILDEIDRAERRLEALAEDLRDIETSDGLASSCALRIARTVGAAGDQLVALIHDLDS
jgi:hypothetical protein